jgi:hypothetical protein
MVEPDTSSWTWTGPQRVCAVWPVTEVLEPLELEPLEPLDPLDPLELLEPLESFGGALPPVVVLPVVPDVAWPCKEPEKVVPVLFVAITDEVEVW